MSSRERERQERWNRGMEGLDKHFEDQRDQRYQNCLHNQPGYGGYYCYR